MKNLNPCPFCGEQVPATYPTLSQIEEDNWNITHCCAGIRRSNGRLGVAIDAYGTTKEEAITNWNKRAAMKPIAVEGYISFRGVMLVGRGKTISRKSTERIIRGWDTVEEIFGDWLYKPDTDCWYCGGHSYPAAVCKLPDAR